MGLLGGSGLGKLLICGGNPREDTSFQRLLGAGMPVAYIVGDASVCRRGSSRREVGMRAKTVVSFCAAACVTLVAFGAGANMQSSRWFSMIRQEGRDVTLTIQLIEEDPPAFETTFMLTRGGEVLFENRQFKKEEADSVLEYGCIADWSDEETADCDGDGEADCAGICGTAYRYEYVDVCVPVRQRHVQPLRRSDPPAGRCAHGGGLLLHLGDAGSGRLVPGRLLVLRVSAHRSRLPARARGPDAPHRAGRVVPRAQTGLSLTDQSCPARARARGRRSAAHLAPRRPAAESTRWSSKRKMASPAEVLAFRRFPEVFAPWDAVDLVRVGDQEPCQVGAPGGGEAAHLLGQGGELSGGAVLHPQLWARGLALEDDEGVIASHPLGSAASGAAPVVVGDPQRIDAGGALDDVGEHVAAFSRREERVFEQRGQAIDRVPVPAPEHEALVRGPAGQARAAALRLDDPDDDCRDHDHGDERHERQEEN